MKLTVLFLMIFTSCGIYAQLNISPSEKEDSYLYVKDRLLYVEKGIHLTSNHKKKTEASIYLRKESQLLQGIKTATNSGDGSISVFQEGTSNAFDYNYWSLPVQATATKDIRINDIIFEPLDKTESRKANLSSGLNGNSRPLNISSKWIYSFSGTSYSNWQHQGEHFDLIPGEGFTMKGVNGTNEEIIEDNPINSGSAQTYDFRGRPNNGKIELFINKDQILLVGNPYPSSLHLDAFLLQNANSTGIAYFWDSKKDGSSHYLTDYEGGYGTYSPGTGLYVPAIFKKGNIGSETGGTGLTYARKFSPIAQGFMIIGKTQGKIHFDNSQRFFQKENLALSQFKSVETAAAIPSVRFNVEFDSSYVRQLVLAFKEDATIMEDHGMDARKMEEADNDISWSVEEEDFVINVLPKKDQELIPLRMILHEDAEVKFSVSEFTSFSPDRLFLFDAKEDLYFSIRTGYFKMKLPKGEYRDRFFISFIEKLPLAEVNSVPEAYKEKPKIVLLNTFDIFQNNLQDRLEIKILYDSTINNLRLYDLNGKLLADEKIQGNQKEYYLPTGNLSTAVYIVKVNTSDGKELTKKIGIRN